MATDKGMNREAGWYWTKLYNDVKWKWSVRYFNGRVWEIGDHAWCDDAAMGILNENRIKNPDEL